MGPGTDDKFSTSGRRLAILFATSLLTLPYVIHCTRFFYATYGFLIACGYEIKRLGIYNFSCLFEERSDRLSEMVEQSIDRRREKGKRFVFLLLLSSHPSWAVWPTVWLTHCLCLSMTVALMTVPPRTLKNLRTVRRLTINTDPFACNLLLLLIYYYYCYTTIITTTFFSTMTLIDVRVM